MARGIAGAVKRSLPREVAHRLVWGLGLQDRVFRWREARLARAAAEAEPAEQPGEPIPSAELRIRAGVAAVDSYLDYGRRTVEEFDAVLRRTGPGLGEVPAVLDLGCGAGRLARWFPGAPERLTGMDVDGALIDWCAANLAGTWRVSPMHGPLPADAGAFDIVYVASVVTHLRRATTGALLAEIARVLRPGGRTLITFHDAVHPAAAGLEAVLGRDGYAVRFDSLEGSNHLSACTTADALAALAAPALTLIEHLPSDTVFNGQAIAVLRRS